MLTSKIAHTVRGRAKEACCYVLALSRLWISCYRDVIKIHSFRPTSKPAASRPKQLTTRKPFSMGFFA
ncbi:hypothetical protein Y032_0925g3067 [Ancylostoma ceylanicum]|uniref:Uncharacterized protein n=1 Tax=Ancylostoma ceylanicum TaxID=53326 RepID=A0A016W9B2_9BILA|nr:hypothetical protein Y032_0925g3067 [Ancylostoma ceylanicum]